MTSFKSKTDVLLQLARLGPVRARDLARLKIPRTYLKRLTEKNLLQQAGRGLYVSPDAPLTELHSLAEVAKRVPHATICLLSALQVHQLTTELPSAVWIMIDVDARRPKVESPRLEIIHASGDALTMGVSIREIEGVSVRITDPAKTVADCFRYRRHVGLEVAITALRDYLAKSRKGKPSQRPPRELLMEAAKVDRVQRIILPYLQALS